MRTVDSKWKEREGWIVTYTGKKFYPLDPDPENIDIIDIAHALSNVCRFTGHVNRFYSVAQHSYMVSLISGEEHALYGLLHDASEAYLCDVSTPVKHSAMFALYRKAEEWLQKMILTKFLVPHSMDSMMPQEVRDADRFMGIMEGMSFMPRMEGAFWTNADERMLAGLVDIDPWSPFLAEEKFLAMFEQLQRG